MSTKRAAKLVRRARRKETKRASDDLHRRVCKAMDLLRMAAEIERIEGPSKDAPLSEETHRVLALPEREQYLFLRKGLRLNSEYQP